MEFTVEDFKKFMDTEEGRKVLNPMFDSKVSNAINTWKTNNLDKVVNEELVKRGYVQTEEQKQMLELQKQIESIKQEKVLAELKATKIAELNANGLDASLAKFINADSEEGIRESVNFFKELVEGQVKKGVKQALADTGAKPEKPNKQEVIPSDVNIMKMSYHERNKLAQENPELYSQLMGEK